MSAVFEALESRDSNAAIVTAVGLVVAAFALVGGVPGLLAGLATAAVWYATSAPYALAAGHVLLVSLFPSGVDPFSFAIVEVAFVVLVLAPAVRTPYPVPLAIVTVASALAFGASAWFLHRHQSLWLAAIGLLGTFALASYAVHRYELVQLGLVSDDRSSDSTTDT